MMFNVSRYSHKIGQKSIARSLELMKHKQDFHLGWLRTPCIPAANTAGAYNRSLTEKQWLVRYIDRLFVDGVSGTHTVILLKKANKYRLLAVHLNEYENAMAFIHDERYEWVWALRGTLKRVPPHFNW